MIRCAELRRWLSSACVIMAAVSYAALADAAAKAPGSANVFLYDMGTESSPVWRGFKRVTPATTYSQVRGYGWVEGADELRAAAFQFLDALGIDCAGGAKDATIHFRQDVPNGDYAIWILAGSMTYPGGYYDSLGFLQRPHDVLMDDRTVIEIRPTADEVWRAVRYEWSKGDDMYDVFVKPRYEWLRLEAHVTTGKLTMGFTHAKDFPISALIIAREDAALCVQEQVEEIERRRKEAWHQIWQTPPVKPRRYDRVSDEERRRGYVLSVVSTMEEMDPWSAPPAGMSRTEVQTFGTPGEQQQCSFAVFALTDLRDVTYEVTDLTSASGAVIPARIIETGLVQFTAGRPTRAAEYIIEPVLILPARSTFVGGNTCKQFWLTIRVPTDASDRVYEGRIRVASLDAPPAELKLRVRVLPFQLPEPAEERFFYFGTMLYHTRLLMSAYDERMFWESVRAETRFLRDNEFCIANCFAFPDQRFTFKDGKLVDVGLSDCEKLMKIVREENAWPRDNKMCVFTVVENLVRACGGAITEPASGKPITFPPTPLGRANYIRGIRIMQEKAVKAGWPELIFEGGGELTNFHAVGLEYGKAVYGANKEAGVKTSERANGYVDMELIKAGLIDYPQPNHALMEPKDLGYLTRRFKENLWAYNYCSGSPAAGRYGMGWFCFKHGVTRSSHEAGIYFQLQPGNIFDDWYCDSPLALPTSLKSLAPTVLLKQFVEGTVDLKYLRFLDNLIRQGESATRPAAKKAAGKARAWLQARLDSLPEGAEGPAERPEWFGAIHAGDWKLGDFEKYRWQAAEHIMAIQKVLGASR